MQYLTDRFLLRTRSPDTERQVGAMPYALHKGRVTFLLITSRRSGRWIFPKGSMIDGQQPWETAALEAFEEAGVEGNIGRQLIGTYRTIKKGPMVRKVVEVDMYPLLVTHQHATWAEMKSRHRHWVLLPEAKRLLSDPVLAGLAKELGQSLVASHYPDTAVINI